MAELERPPVVALYCYFTTLIGTAVKAFAGTGRAGDGLTAKDKLAHALTCVGKGEGRCTLEVLL